MSFQNHRSDCAAAIQLSLLQCVADPFLSGSKNAVLSLCIVTVLLDAVKDVVKLPKTLKPGKYILGFRYDCEATAQVWSNCADIVVAAAATP